jgi:hypothetical protein
MKLRIDEIKVHFTIPMIEQSKYATILCKIVCISLCLTVLFDENIFNS